MKDNNETTCHTKTMHKNKNVRKKDIKIRIEMIISLSQIFIYYAKSNKQDSLADNK